MRLAFIGFGNLGKQIRNLIFSEKVDCFIYFDDKLLENNSKDKTVYPFEAYKNFDFSGYEIIICLGYKHLTLKLVIIEELEQKNYKLFKFVHPSSFISPFAEIADGVIIYPMCNVDTDVTIEKGTLLNNSVTLSHNSKIGASCFIAPGVIVSGNVIIGDSCFLGTGVKVSNSVDIGKNSIVGIGSVVSMNLKEGSYAIGNPLKIKKRLALK